MLKRESEGKAGATSESASRACSVVIPIRCMDCGSPMLTFPMARSPGAAFGEPVWSVLNEPKEGKVVYACQRCFGRQLKSAEEGTIRIRGEG